MIGQGFGIYVSSYLLSLFSSSQHFAQHCWQGAYAGAAYVHLHLITCSNYQLLKELKVGAAYREREEYSKKLLISVIHPSVLLHFCRYN